MTRSYKPYNIRFNGSDANHRVRLEHGQTLRIILIQPAGGFFYVADIKSEYIEQVSCEILETNKVEFQFKSKNTQKKWAEKSTLFLGTVYIALANKTNDSKGNKIICKCFVYLKCSGYKNNTVTTIISDSAVKDVKLSSTETLEIILPANISKVCIPYIFSDDSSQEVVLKQRHDYILESDVKTEHCRYLEPLSSEHHYFFSFCLDNQRNKPNYNKIIFISRDQNGIYQGVYTILIEINFCTKIAKQNLQVQKINIQSRSSDYFRNTILNPSDVEQLCLEGKGSYFIEIVEPSIYFPEAAAHRNAQWKCRLVQDNQHISITEMRPKVCGGISTQCFFLKKTEESSCTLEYEIGTVYLECDEINDIVPYSTRNIFVIIPPTIIAKITNVGKKNKKTQVSVGYVAVEIIEHDKQDGSLETGVESIEYIDIKSSPISEDLGNMANEIAKTVYGPKKNANIVISNQDESKIDNKEGTLISNIVRGKSNKNKILEIFSPTDKDIISLECGGTLKIKMPLNTASFKNSRICPSWTCNLVDVSKKCQFKMWMSCNKIQESGSIVYQEIHIDVITPEKLPINGDHRVGLIQLDNSQGDVRTIFLDLSIEDDSERETWRQRYDYLKCLRSAQRINMKGHQTYQYHANRITLVNAYNGKFKVPLHGEEEIELIYRIDNDDSPILSIVGRQFAGHIKQIDNTIYKLWNGEIVKRFLFNVSSDISGKIAGELSLYANDINTGTRIRISQNQIQTRNKIVSTLEPSVEFLTFDEHRRRIRIKEWKNRQCIAINSNDEVCICLTDLTHFLNSVHHQVSKRSGYKVEIKQHPLPDTIYRQLSDEAQDNISDDKTWYSSVGILNPTDAPWENQEYLLPPVSATQPYIGQIVKIARTKNIPLPIADITFTYVVDDLFTISKTLSLDLDMGLIVSGTARRTILDPIDKICIASGEHFNIRMSPYRKQSVENHTCKDDHWSLVATPARITYHGCSFSAGVYIFHLSENGSVSQSKDKLEYLTFSRSEGKMKKYIGVALENEKKSSLEVIMPTI